MSRKYFYGILGVAAFCLLLIIFSLVSDSSKTPAPSEYVTFPVAPFKSYISGLGIVESEGGNISLGASTDRIVEEILVHSGDWVQKGQVLMVLQNRDLNAELQLQKVALESAKVNLIKLKDLPRKEDLLLAEVNVKNAEIELKQAESQYEMVQGLQSNRALSLEEINRRQYNEQMAQLKVEQAKVEAEKVKQGTPKADLEMAQLQVQQAEANVERIQTELDRTFVKSPIDGTVIEIKTHIGEYPTYPVMIVGNTKDLDIKVSINQFNSHYFNPKAKAVAYIQGDPNLQLELQFVRLIPYLVNKQNLANDVKEIVDTKVLQVIYRIKNDSNVGIYVGQPMDVYIEADFNS